MGSERRDTVLEARPSEYCGTTVAAGSFAPNAWGLYDMHGNVNEWCWDYYGAYDAAQRDDPTGAATGTRHVYRGGGWNDFAGKRIVPFCSHGGGRFGQSLTAIAKLAPDADLGEGLSVHYSGGSTLSEDISNWLKTNGII